MTSRTPTESTSKNRKGSWLALVGVLAGVGVLAFALFAPGIDARRTLTPPPPSVPEPDVTRLEPRVAEAVRAAREAVVADPENADAWVHYAKTLDVHDVYDEAAAAYRQAIKLRPGDPELNYHLAVVLWHVRDGADEAVAIVRRMAELQPKYPPPYARLGTWLAARGRLEEAREAFARAVEIDPTFAYAHRELGQVLLEIGLLEQAQAHLLKAVELIPADRDLNETMARMYRAQGEAEAAEMAEERARRYDNIIKLNDPVREALESLGVSGWHCYRRAVDLIREGKFAQADQELVTVRETLWDNADVHLGLADIYAFRDKKVEALREYREVLRLRGDDPRGHLGVATMLTDRQQFSAALEHWTKAIEAFPSDSQARLGFANSLAATGDLKGAVEQYEAAAKLADPTAETLTNWATALMRTGAADEAIVRYEQAIAMDPKLADAHFNLGLAYEKLGRREEAIAAYRLGAALNPNHPGAKRLAELVGD